MKKLLLAILGLGLLAIGIFACYCLTSDDPEYAFYEAITGQYDNYDDLIRKAAKRYNVPPELIKAVIWRESRFRPGMVGGHGERGLMQIMEPAAADWVKAEKIETFRPTDLFDPKVNIEAGSWYLSRALSHWKDKDDPFPFALAEYNAGRGRVNRWVKDSGQGETAQAMDLQEAMDFPNTKSYVQSILARAEFYRERGEFDD